MAASREIALLHPSLQEKCKKLLDECRKRGINVIVSQTLRTKDYQNSLFAQGRTVPGNVVTNVRYPYSMHCWGLAFDVAILRNGQLTWEEKYYNPVGVIGKQVGLDWGGAWSGFKDRPHYQLKGYDIRTLMLKYGTPEKFIASWKKEEDNVEPYEVVLNGKVYKAAIIDGKMYIISDVVKALGHTVIYKKNRGVVNK